jgi:uncharacterized membrane protein
MQLESKPKSGAASVPQNGQQRWLRPKYLLAAFIFATFLYVIWYDEGFLVHPNHPRWQHIESFKWLLLVHGLLAVVALTLGAFQFSDRLRQRYAKLHRVLGRCYVAGALIGAPMGVYMHYFELIHLYPNNSAYFNGFIANIFNALLWDFCTIMAMLFILQGKVQLHRHWMTRSFSCALIFLEARFVGGIFNLRAYADIILWACVAMAVPLADLLLYLEEFFRTRNPNSKSKPVTQIS